LKKKDRKDRKKTKQRKNRRETSDRKRAIAYGTLLTALKYIYILKQNGRLISNDVITRDI